MKQLHLISLAFLVAASLQGADKENLLMKQAPKNQMERSNPFALEASALQAGRKLFVRECAACHGKHAEGTQSAPSLVTPIVKDSPAGAIFWVF